jgi:hypothetical protein
MPSQAALPILRTVGSPKPKGLANDQSESCASFEIEIISTAWMFARG